MRGPTAPKRANDDASVARFALGAHRIRSYTRSMQRDFAVRQDGDAPDDATRLEGVAKRINTCKGSKTLLDEQAHVLDRERERESVDRRR